MKCLDMKQAKRHHYIPQFLIRNFVNEQDKIFVYDKIQKKIYETSSLNVFLENERNTFENIQGEKDDIIEQIYADLDSTFAPILRKVTITGKMNGEDKKMLLFLAYIIKWRVPQYDDSFKNAKDFFTIDDLGLGIKQDNTKLDVDLESFFNSEMSQESKRFLLAIQPFRFEKERKEILDNSFLISTPYPALLGDCPFNEIQIKSDEFFEDFIFPISNWLNLVYSKRIDILSFSDFLKNGDEKQSDKFLQDFSIARDLGMIHLAQRQVSCSDISYLKYMVKSYNEIPQQALKYMMNSAVFTVLYEYIKEQ